MKAAAIAVHILVIRNMAPYHFYIFQPDQLPLDETYIVSKYVAKPLLVDGNNLIPIRGFPSFMVGSKQYNFFITLYQRQNFTSLLIS